MKSYIFKLKLQLISDGIIFTAKNGEGYVKDGIVHIIGEVHFLYKFDEQEGWYIYNSTTNACVKHRWAVGADYEDLNIVNPLAWKQIIDKVATEIEENETKGQQKQNRIVELKKKLTSWDYKTSKHADGDYTDEEWAEIVAQRKAWREEVNALETELENYE